MVKNKKGFTLVELLAVIAILGVIMVIAVPNVMGIIDKNKKDTYVSDAKQLLTLAEYKFRSGKDGIPVKINNGEAIVLRLACLDDAEITKGPNGGDYHIQNSFVVIGNNGGTYYYYVTLQEALEKGGNRGLPLLDRDFLNTSQSIKEVKDNLSYTTGKNQMLTTNDGKTYRITYDCTAP